MSRAFPSSFALALTALLPSAVLLSLIEAWPTAARLSEGLLDHALLVLRLSGYALPFFLVVSVGIAVGWTVFASLRDAAAARGLTLVDPQARSAAVMALLPALAALLATTVLLNGLATRFKNQELAALLVGLLTLGVVAACAILWLAAFSLARSLEARILSGRIARGVLWLVFLAPLVLVLAWQARVNRGGFSELGWWIVVGPAAAAGLLHFVTSRGIARRIASGPRARRAVYAAPLVAALVAGALNLEGARLPRMVVEAELWSGHLLRGAQMLSDFDRDGASAFFGGGDCQMFDAGVHPGKRDVPGDGIDSDCFNGDAKPARPEPPPVWFDDAPAMGKARNLVVVTIEAVRADHVSALGYARETTPQIDAFAKRSLLFRRMYSGSSATFLSLWSLFSPRSPLSLETKKAKLNGKITKAMPWIPEILQREGLSTGAFLVSWSGFNRFPRGFDVYDMDTPVANRGGQFFGFTAETTVTKTIEFIDDRKDERFFAWTHLTEPHAAYELNKEGKVFGAKPIDLYDGEIWTADRAVGRLVDHLEKTGRLEDTIVFVTGDHGEGLGDHGVARHFKTVYDAEVHTLGLLYVPGVEPAVVDQPVVHRDVAATTMNVLGIKRGFEDFRANSLVPLLQGEPQPPHDVFVELAGFGLKKSWVGLVRWPYKLVHRIGADDFELFQLEDDPGETQDIGSQQRNTFLELRERTLEHVRGALQR